MFYLCIIMRLVMYIKRICYVIILKYKRTSLPVYRSLSLSLSLSLSVSVSPDINLLVVYIN